MNIILLLMGGIMFAFMFVFWKNRFQVKRYSGKMSSKSTSLALIRATPRSDTGSLSVNHLAQDIFRNFPHSIAMQKRILVNLRILEYKLAEMEHFLNMKGFNGALINRRSTERVTPCNDNTSNH